MTVDTQSYCQACKLEGKAVTDCRIRMYRYQTQMKKCPKETGQPEVPSTTFRVVAVAELFGAPFPSRLDPDDPELAELTESIRTYGVLEPILVRSKPSGALEVVAGERRVRAAKKARVPTVPVLIKALSDEQALILQLTENLQRRDLTEEEKTRGLTELARRTKWSAQQIADKLKMSERWVYKYLPEEFKRDYERAPESARRANLTETTQNVPSEPSEAGSEPAPQETVRRAEVQPNPRWNLQTPAVTTSIPGAPRAPEAPAHEPGPEPLDVADFTCPECHQDFRIVHVSQNLHRFVPVKKEPA